MMLPVIMTKISLKITLFNFLLFLISCKKGIELPLEPDYKVVEMDFGFHNYMRNIRDKSE